MAEGRTHTKAAAGEKRHGSPILWARWGSISKLIAQRLRPQQPPTLVLSLPRSGSSWVGETLGRADNALYLREPVTQSDQSFYYKGTVFSPDEPDVAASYQMLADRAFSGCPDFAKDVVQFPLQWALWWRRPRRLVIKEVNPLACEWYLQRYQPRIVFLVRHPAGVALSCHVKGWVSTEPAAWANNGIFQAEALRFALDALAEYPAHEFVVYKEVCADPLAEFERMFAFADLIWNDRIQGFIGQDTSDSKKMIDAWRGKLPPGALEALGSSYRQFDLPWYQKDEEW
ncbi:MAG: sulfotransferase [Anaerolineae bacterium]|nr:sulfotransferase [Anaerolineae bacterium]